MVTIEERNDNFYKKDGFKALEGRFNTLREIYNKNEYPFGGIILGFGKLEIENKHELIVRIKELSEITGLDCSIRREIVKNTDGVETIKETMWP